MSDLALIDAIQSKIYRLPGRPPFMLAFDVAEQFEVHPRAIHQAVRRHPQLFPGDFCFMLTDEEVGWLQNEATLPKHLIGQKLRAFTREGVNALAGVLHSSIADKRFVFIIRAWSAFEEKCLPKLKAAIAAEAAAAPEPETHFMEVATDELLSLQKEVMDLQRFKIRYLEGGNKAVKAPPRRCVRLTQEIIAKVHDGKRRGLSTRENALHSGVSQSTVSWTLRFHPLPKD